MSSSQFLGQSCAERAAPRSSHSVGSKRHANARRRNLAGRTRYCDETLGNLILPEVFEAVRRQGRVADRGHNRSVAEIGLDGASVVAVVGELEPAGMHEERE